MNKIQIRKLACARHGR